MTKAADSEKIPIEKIDSATRAPEPLEKAAAEQQQRDLAARAAGSNPGLPFLPPGDVPGQIADPNFPSPPPYDNTYSFTVYYKANPAAAPYLGQAANPLGDNISIVAPNFQAAYTALMASPNAANFLKVLGPCASWVGADHGMSQAAGASAPMQAKPISGSQQSQQSSSHGGGGARYKAGD